MTDPTSTAPPVQPPRPSASKPNPTSPKATKMAPPVPPMPRKSADGMDEERDTFEDTPRKPRAKSPAATRSLTERRPSSSSVKDRIKAVEESAKDETKVPNPSAPLALKAEKDRDDTKSVGSIANAAGNVGAGQNGDTKRPGSVKSISVATNLDAMDDVNLGDESTRGISPTRASIHSVSSLKNAVASSLSLSRTSSSQGANHQHSQSVTSPDSYKTPASATSISAQAANMARGFKSPFSWLSRTGSNPVQKPPSSNSGTLHGHRASEDMRFSDTDSSNRHSTASLKDRFKAVRLREEAGITEDVVGTPDSASIAEKGLESPTSRRKSSSTVASATINPNLAPGMAAGIAEGPTDQPVDWDLWQAVVSEGPAAVARSSPEELNRAIAAGIPQAIRGVIWQVMAGSKNESMEKFYHDLVARGTEKERAASMNGDANGNGHLDASDRGSVSSEVHSAAGTGDAGRGPDSPAVSVNMSGSAVEGFTNPHAPKPKSAKEELVHIQVLEKTIRRDMGARTSYSKFLMSSGLQEGLFGICKAYALYDEEVGYAQGMNFVAMPLLFNMREEEAFCLFVRLMSKYGLREMFTQDMPGLHLHLYQFERLLEDFEPALYCHLNRRGVTPNLYATQWILTLFAYRFPLQLVQRIYDLILSDSLEVSILKFAIVLMQKNRDTLLGMGDMSAISHFLKEKLFDVYIDKAPSSNSILESGFFGSTGGVDKEVYKADLLVQDACAVNITKEMLAGYTTEWEEKRRIEKERDDELEGLRNTASKLAARVRSLEARVEKSDAEHVQVASDLVRAKVDNDALMDENESLKGRVQELTKVVASQTEEVENRLRSEMDEVMKRNLEVHNANRALEEEKGEMERALVESKLMHAQINSEHESLKQRWNSVAQMMMLNK